MTDYPLADSWNIWYAPRGKRSKFDSNLYGNNLNLIGSFHSLQEFFNYYTHLKRPSGLPIDTKLMFFRKGCKPMWEQFPKGGTWILMLKKKELEELNLMWEQLIMATIGEQFESMKVTGIVLSKRSKKNLLELWISDRSDETKLMIGERLREILGLNQDNLTFYFKEHFKSMQEKSTLKNRESYTFVKTPCETPVFTPINPVNQGGELDDEPEFKLTQ